MKTWMTFALMLFTTAVSGQWQMAGDKLRTRWAADVRADRVLPEYPRPQMVRAAWQNLNGLWDYAIVAKAAARPERWEGKILVPFCVESALSGVGRDVQPDQRLWYRRTVRAARPDDGGRLLLHFGAVDWQAEVWVNGRAVGKHEGGFDPFTFDITEALQSGAEQEQEVVVAVWDPTDTGSQPRGKQQLKPQGIWYTAVTGMWQTVWLEPVPAKHVRGMKLTPELEAKCLKLSVDGPAGEAFVARAKLHGTAAGQVSGVCGQECVLPLSAVEPWAPGHPTLYDLEVKLASGDAVASYFGLRLIQIKPDQEGNYRIFLNGQQQFQYGPLDQGWWPDGLYTAPTDEALRFDIEATLKMGFNVARKHVKVEPARWYYWCDRLGLMVWQDMPSAHPTLRTPGDMFVQPGQPDAERPAESARQFEAELKALIDDHYNHPCIVVWVVFNEGWGQYDTARVAGWAGRYDPTRLLNSVSGWVDRGIGSFLDIHSYPAPAIEPPGPGRAVVVGEFGGLGLPVEGHLWLQEGSWGYQGYKDIETLLGDYQRHLRTLRGLTGLGVAAAIYTQTTDVEREVNGWLTYDRAVTKADAERLKGLHTPLYAAAPKATWLVETSQFVAQPWRQTQRRPGGGWRKPDYDDGEWQQISGPLMAGNHPELPKGSPWDGKEIWLRRSFRTDREYDALRLAIYHWTDEGEIFIDGKLVLKLDQRKPTRRHYHHLLPTDPGMRLPAGEHVLAVRAMRKGPQRAMDVGLYAVEER